MKEAFGWKCSNIITVLDRSIGAKREVSCGRCLPCCVRKEQEWVLRMLLEQSCSPYSVFATMTYSEAHRPYRLDYEHVQKFFKSLRKKFPSGSVRFCSRLELGETTQREHGHLIIFSTFPICQSFGLQQHECWPHGALLFQPAKKARMRYLAKYVHKNFLSDPASQTHWSTSRRPGIGVVAIRRLASQFASRALKMPDPCVQPTVLRIGRTLYPLSRTMRRHFKMHCENLGVRFLERPSEGIWNDFQGAGVLEAKSRRRTVEGCRVIELLTDRRLAEKERLNGSTF